MAKLLDVDLQRENALLREENDTLREQVRHLQELLMPLRVFPPEWRLTRSETAVMDVLYAREFASKEMIIHALYTSTGKDEAEMKIVDVFICKIRKKLKPYGIEIRTVRGLGYQLAPNTRSIIRAAGEQAVAA